MHLLVRFRRFVFSRRLLALTALLCGLDASAALTRYTFTGTGTNGWSATGSFAYEDTSTLADRDYAAFSAGTDLADFSVTLNRASTSTTTAFTLADVSFDTPFVVVKEAGALTDFEVGIAQSNPDGYILSLSDVFKSDLTLGGNLVSTVTWGGFTLDTSTAAVPEPAASGLLAALSVGALAVFSRRRR